MGARGPDPPYKVTQKYIFWKVGQVLCLRSQLHVSVAVLHLFVVICVSLRSILSLSIHLRVLAVAFFFYLSVVICVSLQLSFYLSEVICVSLWWFCVSL